MPRKTTITILLALLIPIPAFAQEYLVKFERPAKVGEKYSISASGGMSVKSTVVEDQQVVESEKLTDYQVQFAAMAEVLEVDEKGREAKVAFTVEKFTKIEGSNLTELVPPGKVIIADPNSYSLQDGFLSSQAQEALVLISIAEPSSPLDDEILGTTEPKQVGESWALDNTLVAKAIQRKGLGLNLPEALLKLENASGVAKIAGLEEIGGVEYLDIWAELEAEFPRSIMNLWEGAGADVDKGILRLVFQGYFPVDRSIPIQATSITVNVQLVLKGTPGTGAEGLVIQTEGQRTSQILQTAGLDGQLLQEALNDKHKEIIEALKKAGAKE